MRAHELMIDRPVSIGASADVTRSGDALTFTRALHATADEVMRHWLEPALRQRWLPMPPASRIVPLVEVFPVFWTAEVTDGVHGARLELHLEEDGPLTVMRLAIAPYEPLTKAMLIQSGHADGWEERLYLLADLLFNNTTQKA
jgi:hypothetical protein